MSQGDHAVGKIKACLETVLPEETMAQLRDRWTRHAAHARPVVTLVGAYNTGKTTLVRRLLEEDEQAIPGWATVSARPETFTSHEVDVLGCTLRDTPGFSGGVSHHDEALHDCMATTDALLICVTIQLPTSDRRQVADLVQGRWMRAHRGPPPLGSLALLITRIDQSGADADACPEEFQDLMDLKVRELKSQLGLPAKGGPDIYPVSVHAKNDAWDGMTALTRHLQSLAPRCQELRDAAETRYWRAVAVHHLESLERQRDAEAKALAEARAQCAQGERMLAEVAELAQEARARLHRRISDQLRTLLARGAADRSRATDQVMRTVRLWWVQEEQALDDLAARFDASVGPQAKGWELPDLERLLDALDEPPPGPPPVTPALANAGQVLPGVRVVVNQLQEKRLGMSLRQTREELDKWKQRGEDYFRGRAAAFKTPANVFEARGHILVDGVLEAVPALLELATLIAEPVERHLQEKKESEHSARLEGEIERCAQETLDAVCPIGRASAWSSGLVELERILRERIEPSARSAALLQDSLASLQDRITRIREASSTAH